VAERERQAVGVLQQILGVPDADVHTEGSDAAASRFVS
jgi:hypothetical protein